MFRLSVRSEFSSAHNLRGYKGKCEDLHGHNWKVEAVFEAEDTDNKGLVLDFHRIKKMLKGVLERLDHKYLNEIAFFRKNNPTSENLARYIFAKMRGMMPVSSCRLKEITVWESENCSATYSERI